MTRRSSWLYPALILWVALAGCRPGTPGEDALPATSSPDVVPLPGVLAYEARGSEFKWSFAYAGGDGELGTPDDVPLGNDMLVPAGKPVELRLLSDDYIYILAAPDTGAREIAIPDMVHTLRFNSGPPGEHELLSDPLCGFRFYHDEVMGRINVVSEEEFFAHLASAP